MWSFTRFRPLSYATTLLLAWMGFVVTGCTMHPIPPTGECLPSTEGCFPSDGHRLTTVVPMPQPASPPPSAEAIRLEAVGYGASSSFDGYTPGQKRLLAIRAARLDAYRALAEQLYGVRITGSTTVSAMVTQNDSFRSFVDAQIRGARTVTVTPMAEGNYEVIVEIYLNQDFYNYLRAMPITPPTSNMPLPVQRTTPQGCATGTVGCAPAGPYYYREP